MYTSSNKDSNNPLLVFYVYLCPIDLFSGKMLPFAFGSEIACVELAKQLTEQYNVFILYEVNDTNNIRGIVKHNSVQFSPIDYFITSLSSTCTNIDVLIVSRSLSFFENYSLRGRKNYFWLHDTVPGEFIHPTLGIPTEDKVALLGKVVNSIDAVVCLTPWHKSFLSQVVAIPEEKLHIIGNGVNPRHFIEHKRDQEKKIKYRFVWTSCFDRGIERMLEIFSLVRRSIPEATLDILREPIGYSGKTYYHLVSKYAGVHIRFLGKLDAEELAKVMCQADIWLYPTEWPETFCITALEAQAAGLLCIASNYAALQDVIADRGILLPITTGNEIYASIIISALLNKDTQVEMNELREKGRSWAYKQSWIHKAEEWIELINK